MNTKNVLEKMTNILLYISTFFISIPGTFFNKSIQIFLIVAMLYILAVIVWLYKNHRLKEIIIKGKIYAVFTIMIFVISTVKYIVEILCDKDITFFTVYQIVIFAIFGFFVFAKIYVNNKVISKLFMIYAYTTTMLIVINQNKYLFDLGNYRFEGAYKNPNILALYAVISIMQLIYLIAQKCGLILINEICISICVASCILSQSRSGMLGLVVGLLLTTILEILNRGKGKWIINALKRATCIIIITVISLLLIKPSVSDRESARISGAIDTAEIHNKEYELPLNNVLVRVCSVSNYNLHVKTVDERGNYNIKMMVESNKNDRFSLDGTGSSSIKGNLRYTIWEAYMKNLPDYFWFGTDYSLSDRPVIEGKVRDSHNTFIFLLFRYGIFVASSVVIVLIYISVKLYKKNRISSSTAVILSMLMSMIAISLLNDLPNTALYYFVIAVSYAYIYVNNGRGRDGKVNVLHVFSTLNKGGAESRIMDIFRRLDTGNVQFDFVVTSPNSEQHYFYNEVKKRGGEIYEIASWRKVGFKGLYMQWKKVFKSKEYSVVHSHVSVESGIMLFFAWLNNVPIRIAHARNGGVYNASKLKKIYLTITKGMTIIFSTHKIYCSDEAAKYVFGKCYKVMPRTYFLPNAIDIGLYSEVEEDEIEELKKEMGIPDCKYIVGTVGNARKVKNHLFLVKVFKRVLEINPKTILVIVGRNDEDEEAKQYVIDNEIEDKVLFVGQKDNIPQLLQLFDVFVLPSLSEGAPGSVIEAQAAGVPCILSDTITRAVDVNCGLVKYLSLNDDVDIWSQEILLSCMSRQADIDYVHNSLYKAGYDVSSSMDKLMKIYKAGY